MEMRSNLEKFYSDESIDVWKKVIGQDLHYHVGWGDGDILFNAVEYLYQFIGENKKVLDCGCGWGGTGKVLQRDLNCKVTGITNSSTQYKYIKKRNRDSYTWVISERYYHSHLYTSPSPRDQRG